MRTTHTLLAGLLLCQAVVADDKPQAPLPERIDSLVESRLDDFSRHASPVCDDATFLRRVTLDLAGTIPSGDATREFVSDKTPSSEKRRRLVETLLAGPRHPRRMQYLLDWMLMERRTGSTVPQAEWQEYLRRSAVANKPWDVLAREILAADGADKKTRAPAKFYLDREFDLTVVTRDVGRLFLGVDLECAQCHDHPAIEAYKQRHYYGINAFLKRSYLFTDPKSKLKSLGEKAEGDVTFTSVFDDSKGKTAPRVLDLPELFDPKDTLKQYVTKPAKNARGVPKYSRRQRLGEALTDKDNADFRLNIANRLWAVMIGRGLVEPLDLRHAANPPSHPELLTLLGDSLHEHKYDLRWFLGQLALTRAYQRGSRPREGSADVANRHFGVGLLKPLSPEQLAWASMEATGLLGKVRTESISKLKKAARKAAEKKAGEKKAGEKKAGEKKAGEKKAGERKAGKEKAVKKEAPPPEPDPPSLVQVEEAVRKAVAEHITTFVTEFAAHGGQKTTFSATAPQALFLVNGPLLRSWLKPQDDNLVGRLSKLDQPAAVAEELYISILNRQPDDTERKEVVAYLEGAESREAALGELAWALLISAEFRFNH